MNLSKSSTALLKLILRDADWNDRLDAELGVAAATELLSRCE